MKKNSDEKNMIIAFVLNLTFAIIELIGGILTNSVSILSDSIHDLGDSISIGISLILDKISKKKPNEKYTYGYGRYSVLGAMINLFVLIVGTTIVLYTAIPRLLHPQAIHYEGMIGLAVLGIFVNGIGAFKTTHSEKISSKVISLHLLEDVLGWIAVLFVSIAMKIFELPILDPILSIGISIFILYNVFKNFKSILNVFLEKTPKNVNISEIKSSILEMKDVIDIHHIHVWSMDGENNYLTAHVVLKDGISNIEISHIKGIIKHKLEHLNIQHSTLEFEGNFEKCEHDNCEAEFNTHVHTHEH